MACGIVCLGSVGISAILMMYIAKLDIIIWSQKIENVELVVGIDLIGTTT